VSKQAAQLPSKEVAQVLLASGVSGTRRLRLGAGAPESVIELLAVGSLTASVLSGLPKIMSTRGAESAL